MGSPIASKITAILMAVAIVAAVTSVVMVVARVGGLSPSPQGPASEAPARPDTGEG